MVHCESDGSIPRLSPLDLRVKAETRCSIVRVKSSKVIEFLRVNVDLSTRAHMVRMMLIRLGQLSFMVAYRYVRKKVILCVVMVTLAAAVLSTAGFSTHT